MNTEKLLGLANRLSGISYPEWLKLRMLVDRKFDIKKNELEKELKLVSFETEDISAIW